jgi:hypothetical protein
LGEEDGSSDPWIMEVAAVAAADGTLFRLGGVLRVPVEAVCLGLRVLVLRAITTTTVVAIS